MSLSDGDKKNQNICPLFVLVPIQKEKKPRPIARIFKDRRKGFKSKVWLKLPKAKCAASSSYFDVKH